MDNAQICAAVIVAAGSGTRMGGPVPKQFLKISGKPVLAHTLLVFEKSPVIRDIVIVTGSGNVAYCAEEIGEKYGISKVIRTVAGGKTRCRSVMNGLIACRKDTDFVFIHDGVRPMITEDIIERGLSEAERNGSAVASVTTKDTVRITDDSGNVFSTPPRKNVRLIQTPQIFKYRELLSAYQKMTDAEMSAFTDDGMVWEKYAGERLHLYEGSAENIKITTPEDLEFAKRMLGE